MFGRFRALVAVCPLLALSACALESGGSGSVTRSAPGVDRLLSELPLRREPVGPARLRFRPDARIVDATTDRGILYMVDSDSTLHAVDLGVGRVRWRSELTRRPTAPVRIVGSRIVAVAGRHITILETERGRPRIATNLAEVIVEPGDMTSTTLYAGRHGDDGPELTAIDLVSGRVGWSTVLSAPLVAAPVIAGAPGFRVVATATGDGRLTVWPARSADADRPAPLWSGTFVGREAALCGTENALFVADGGGELIRYEVDSGWKTWRRSIGLGRVESVRCDHDRVIVDLGDEIVSTALTHGQIRSRRRAQRYLGRVDGVDYFETDRGVLGVDIVTGADRGESFDHPFMFVPVDDSSRGTLIAIAGDSVHLLR